MAEVIAVETVRDLSLAFDRAQPGDRIELAPGTYPVRRLDTRGPGRIDAPIVVSAAVPGTAIIQARSVEAFSVSHPDWRFEHLVFRGTERTEHAYHVSGDADRVSISDHLIVDFHSAIKVNGDRDGRFPDNLTIERNRIYNRGPRLTDVPVTPIDVVGGTRTIVRDNYVADFVKQGGDGISYGMFLKGNSSFGIIERNLVICNRQVHGGTTVGLSLGGGGSSDNVCEERDCTTEHRNGSIRNNIVLSCSDVGIYLNRARESEIYHNTLLLTAGVDVRFATTSAEVSHNVLSGAVRARNGGRLLDHHNLEFGIETGLYLPGASRKLRHRISDYDSKFPNWVSREDVVWAQSTLEWFFRGWINSGLGLGYDATLAAFPGLADGDLRPAPALARRLDSPTSRVELDFWGRPRQAAVLGALDYSLSDCPLRLRMAGDYEPGCGPAPPGN